VKVNLKKTIVNLKKMSSKMTENLWRMMVRSLKKMAR
jgi:ribosomal protein L18E